MARRVPFPSTRESKDWPGAWCWGVDYSGNSVRVIAVGVNRNDIKHGIAIRGPIALDSDANAAKLERWARRVLDRQGGYVHLISAGRAAA